MNKSYIIVALFLVVLGVFLFMGNSKKSEAPKDLETTTPKVGVTEELPAKEEKTSAVSTTNIKEINITGDNFFFAPSGVTVKKGDTVKITFKNSNGTHDLRIDEFNVATRVLKSGESDTVQFVADKVGTFDYYCAIGSHRAMGMEGQLKIEE